MRTAKTILVNAVMGYTSKGFHEGTIGLDRLIHNNMNSSLPADVFFGGGDTLKEFKSLSPGSYLNALENPQTYLFTGGGTVLKVIEEGEIGKLDIVRVLTEEEEGEDEGGEQDGRNGKENAIDKVSASVTKMHTPECHERANCDCSDLNDTYPKQRV